MICIIYYEMENQKLEKQTSDDGFVDGNWYTIISIEVLEIRRVSFAWFNLFTFCVTFEPTTIISDEKTKISEKMERKRNLIKSCAIEIHWLG